MFTLWLAIICARERPLQAQTTGTPSDADSQGQQLAQKILKQTPPGNSTVTGDLVIRGEDGTRASIPVTCVIVAAGSNWQNIYQAVLTNGAEVLWIYHTAGQADRYFQGTYPAALSPRQLAATAATAATAEAKRPLAAAAWMTPFAGSDFCPADLGLEFFHWPGQKVLKLDIHRSRGCTVLESTTPTPEEYSRVVSWIDNETLGIVEACAYDGQGRKLKDFYPRDFKKVDGQWRVQTLVMENLQTDSRSRLEFNAKK